MRKPSPPRRPRADRTVDALFAFAEAVLDDLFTDPDNQKNYETLARGGRGAGVKAGERVSIGLIELSDDGEVGLDMCAGSPEILVAITHPRFNANIAARYDLNAAMMRDARLVQIEGDRKQAKKCADKWLEEFVLDGLDDGDEDLEDTLTSLLPGDDSPFDGEADPGEPPPPSPRDKAKVDALARALAREMKRKNPDLLSHHESLAELEQSPQTLWPILDGMVAACAASPRDEVLIDAWRFILESQLTLIRYRVDRGWHWAVRMVEDFQGKLIGIGHAGQVSPEDFAAIAGALGEAGIEVKSKTRRALADAGLTLPEAEQRADLAELMRGLMDQMASAASGPFEVTAGLNESMRVMPSEIRCFLAHEFARSAHAVLRDAVPLMLLSEDQDVRRAAADAMKQTASVESTSPEALRRMIAIRNWVPQADRPPIDLAIREARTKNVDCAPWPPAQDLMVTASVIDGSGAQSVVLTGQSGRKGVLAGMLLKLRTGVADSWCGAGSSRRGINETLAALRETGAAGEVDRAYLDDAVQHAIAAGTASGRPAGTALLQIAELAGGATWRDRRLDIAAEAKRLFDALPAEHRLAGAIEASLRRSGTWIDEGFAESWFLDDAEVRAIVKSASRRDSAQVVRRLLEQAMPKRRAEWAERFLLLALRARAATHRADKAYGNDLIVLAHTLCGDRGLDAVPLIVAIVLHTVEVARIARW